MHIVQGLIIADPWIGYILDGSKTWEMRSSATQVRGAVALIRKGTGAVSGVAKLAGVGWALTQAEMLETCHLHKIPAEMIRSGEVARWNTPWILTDVRRLATSVQYSDPSGAVTWVNLADDVSREIAAQLDEAPDETPSRSAFTAKDKPLSWTGSIREDYWPGPFDPIEDWEQWLAEVHAMPDFPMKDYCIETAKQTIERMRQYLRAERHGVNCTH